jgi:hypothetical protein
VAGRALVKARPALALVLCLLAGCAERWSYTKASMTPAKLDHDLEACRKQAHRPHRFGLTREGRIDQDVLNQCMQHRGYTARRED